MYVRSRNADSNTVSDDIARIFTLVNMKPVAVSDVAEHENKTTAADAAAEARSTANEENKKRLAAATLFLICSRCSRGSDKVDRK